jgi:TolB protein
MKSRASVLVLFGIAALAPAAGTAGTSAPPPAPIVYVTAGGSAGSADLAVRRSGGDRWLTRNRIHEGLPSWSPDRKRIVFVRAHRFSTDIYVMKADGTGARPLAGGTRRGSDELYPAWSPDGRLIAFSSYRDGRGDVYVMRADGSGVRRVTRAPAGVDNMQPRFSPDGRHLVVASTRGGETHEVFRIRLADGVAKRLTSSPGGSTMPDVSPDGRRIAYVSYRESGEAAIYVANADGRGAREVARHAGRQVAYPRFSPDGRALLYSTFVAGETVTGYRLRTVSLDGRQSADLGAGAEADW